MKILKIIVDEKPEICRYCDFCSNYHCTITEEFVDEFGVIPSSCPIVCLG